MLVEVDKGPIGTALPGQVRDLVVIRREKDE